MNRSLEVGRCSLSGDDAPLGVNLKDAEDR